MNIKNSLDQLAILDAMAELAHLENRTSADEAMRVAIAQMCAGALFVEAHAGKQKADQVVLALWQAQVPADPICQRLNR
ncbi:hypothetical protein ACVILI_001680 [Mesorhizobium sp. USDA 4775]